VPLLRLKVARVIESFHFRASSMTASAWSGISTACRVTSCSRPRRELRQCARAVLELHERARGVLLV